MTAPIADANAALGPRPMTFAPDVRRSVAMTCSQFIGKSAEAPWSMQTPSTVPAVVGNA